MSGPSELLPFPSTCWSRIRIGTGHEDEAGALETLARAYGVPIVAYLRLALERSSDEACDLAQDFFVWAIETRFLAKADPARGRFRAFLKVALRHYVADHDRRVNAGKRGGGARVLSIEAEANEELLPADGERGPEAALDDAWRAALVEAALERTRVELEQRGKPLAYAVFQDYVLDGTSETDYRTIAERHRIGVDDVSNHLSRVKQLYRAHVRALVLETVRSREDLDEELAWLVGERREAAHPRSKNVPRGPAPS